MSPCATLTFILSEMPDQGSVGKTGYDASLMRRNQYDYLYLDIVPTEYGPMLYATTSWESQES